MRVLEQGPGDRHALTFAARQASAAFADARAPSVFQTLCDLVEACDALLDGTWDEYLEKEKAGLIAGEGVFAEIVDAGSASMAWAVFSE